MHHARQRALKRHAALQPLRAYEDASTVFPGNLASLFIVSRVRLQDGEGPLTVTVEKAAGAKCGRCWTFSEKVGALDPPEVCERAARQYEVFPYGTYEWPALLRLADERSPGFRD